MPAESLSRQRRSRPIVFSGVLCAAALLAGCTDDEDQRRLSPQVSAADGVYRAPSSGGAGSSGATTWRTGSRGSGADGSVSDRDGGAQGDRDADGGSESQHSSQRGGFGSSGRGFFRFGG